jgi:patatin-related protein
MLPSLDEDEREEIRLALALNGGTSLAVWMGGVAQELDRFRRRDSTYGALLDLVHSTSRIDVIAGTSAGGLNGALLGLAIGRNVELSGLAELWVNKGALFDLLRDPFERDPPSLLRGDEYFLPALRDAFTRIAGSAPATQGSHPLVLMITATALKAQSRGFPDHFGSVIGDSDHRAIFRFERNDSVDHFGDPDAVDRLALAARTSASFPGAFEASFIPIGASEPGRPDMDGILKVSGNRWAIDGGVLVNTPVGPMIDAVLKMPASRQVRRVVAIVVPRGRDVGGPTKPDDHAKVPAVLDVVLASLTGIPRQQSIGEDLDRLTDYNREVARRRDRRQQLLANLGPEALRELAGRVSDTYVRIRAGDTVDALLEAIFADAEARDVIAETEVSAAPEATRGSIQRALRAAFSEPVPPPQAYLRRSRRPTRGSRLTKGWPFGTSALERSASVVADVLRTALQIVPLANGEVRGRLRRLRTETYAAIEDLGRFQNAERRVLGHQWEAATEAATSEDRLLVWAEALRAAREQAAPPEALADISRRLASALTQAAESFRGIELAGDEGETLEQVVTALAPSADPDEAARQLLALEVAERVLSTADRSPRQPIQLIQISADTPSIFSARATAERKLTGVQLNHFGAFYKRSWRANDWLWGRLDGSARLAQIILSPRRLRQLGYSAQEATGALRELVLSGDDSKDSVLAEHWDEQLISGELRYLDFPEVPVPDALPACVRAASARLQLDILLKDLEPVARAVREDLALRTDDLVPANLWAARFPKDGRLAPKDAADLFGQCTIADERLIPEIGSDYFTQVSTKALASATNVTRGKHSGLPDKARRFVGPARNVALATYLLARGAVSRHRTASIAVIVALAVSAAVLSVALVSGENPFGGLAVVAAVVLIGGLLVSMIRSGVAATLAVAGLLLAGAVASVIVCVWSHDGPWTGDLRECLSWSSALVPLIPVVVLIVAATALGLVRRGRWAARPRP